MERVRDVRKVASLRNRMKCRTFGTVDALKWNAQTIPYGQLVIYLGGKENINGVSVTCSRNDGLEGAEKLVDESGFTGSIICPNLDIICGTSTKPFHCLNGAYSDEKQKCICNAGWKG